jgi:hypothetical protein
MATAEPSPEATVAIGLRLSSEMLAVMSAKIKCAMIFAL